MTKQEEIDLLNQLKGDTYFAQYFGQDIDKMCLNIKNDFCIEMDCSFNETLQDEIESKEERIKELSLEVTSLKSEVAYAKADGELMAEQLLAKNTRKIVAAVLKKDDSDEMLHILAAEVGDAVLIRDMRELGLHIRDWQADWLLKALPY